MFTSSNNLHAGRKLARAKYFLSLFATLAFALALYPGRANAQIIGDLVVNVPFQFHAGNATLPSGEYRIHMLDDSELTIMEITSADGSTSAIFQVEETDARTVPTQNELIFNRYGDRYYLAQLFEQGSDSGSQVIQSRDEQKINKQTKVQAQEHVPATRRAQQGN